LIGDHWQRLLPGAFSIPPALPVVADQSINLSRKFEDFSLHTLSACTRVVVEAQGVLAILSGVGMHETKMFNPVRPGDTLSVEAWWTELKKSKSKPDRGYASIKCKVTNQRKEPIIEYGYRYLLACKKSKI
jgi:hypothetical protein